MWIADASTNAGQKHSNPMQPPGFLRWLLRWSAFQNCEPGSPRGMEPHPRPERTWVPGLPSLLAQITFVTFDFLYWEASWSLIRLLPGMCSFILPNAPPREAFTFAHSWFPTAMLHVPIGRLCTHELSRNAMAKLGLICKTPKHYRLCLSVLWARELEVFLRQPEKLQPNGIFLFTCCWGLLC